MRERIGIVTGGGDCPGLNAVIRAVVKSATKRGWDTVGFLGGYDGMLEPMRHRTLDYKEMDALLFVGGTVLGTANRGRFAVKTGHGEAQDIPVEILNEAKANFQKLGLRALVTVGGDGSLTIAQRLFEQGIPVVGVPKTIDNDIEATATTFGFDSAVACATDALDRLRTTAQSHERVMVLEVMGRYAGWIAMHARIAERERNGKHFTLVVAAEGAREDGKPFVTSGPEERNREARLGGIGAVVAAEIQRRTGKEARVCVLGHLQRGGAPTTFDRLLCTRFGAKAVQLVAEEKYGHMVALHPPDTVAVKLTDAIGRLRTVPLDGDMVRTARALGISFGD